MAIMEQKRAFFRKGNGLSANSIRVASSLRDSQLPPLPGSRILESRLGVRKTIGRVLRTLTLALTAHLPPTGRQTPPAEACEVMSYTGFHISPFTEKGSVTHQPQRRRQRDQPWKYKLVKASRT